MRNSNFSVDDVLVKARKIDSIRGRSTVRAIILNKVCIFHITCTTATLAEGEVPAKILQRVLDQLRTDLTPLPENSPRIVQNQKTLNGGCKKGFLSAADYNTFRNKVGTK